MVEGVLSQDLCRRGFAVEGRLVVAWRFCRGGVLSRGGFVIEDFVVGEGCHTLMTRISLSVCVSMCIGYTDFYVEYPASFTQKYLVGEFLASAELSVLKACTDRYIIFNFPLAQNGFIYSGPYFHSLTSRPMGKQ